MNFSNKFILSFFFSTILIASSQASISHYDQLPFEGTLIFYLDSFQETIILLYLDLNNIDLGDPKGESYFIKISYDEYTLYSSEYCFSDSPSTCTTNIHYLEPDTSSRVNYRETEYFYIKKTLKEGHPYLLVRFVFYIDAMESKVEIINQKDIDSKVVLIVILVIVGIIVVGLLIWLAIYCIRKKRANENQANIAQSTPQYGQNVQMAQYPKTYGQNVQNGANYQNNNYQNNNYQNNNYQNNNYQNNYQSNYQNNNYNNGKEDAYNTYNNQPYQTGYQSGGQQNNEMNYVSGNNNVPISNNVNPNEMNYNSCTNDRLNLNNAAAPIT